MKGVTHVMGEQNLCSRCGAIIPPIVTEGKPRQAQMGDRVGVLEATKHTDVVAYIVGHKDSNQQCSI